MPTDEQSLETTTEFHIDGNNALVLTVNPDKLNVCEKCPRLHVWVLSNATPARLRILAKGLRRMADTMGKVEIVL